MGYTTCTISHLVIETGAPVRAVFLANIAPVADRNAPVYDPASWYVPVSGPIKASFDDFARAENLKPSECVDIFLQKYCAGQKLDEIAQAAAKQNISIPAPNHAMAKNKQDSPLAIAYIREDVYQSLLNLTHEGKARNFESETANQFETLKTLCLYNKNQLERMGDMKVMGIAMLFRLSGTDARNDKDVRQILQLFETAGGGDIQSALGKEKEELLESLLNGDEEKAKSIFKDLLAVSHIHSMMHVLNRSWQPANAVTEETFTQAHVVFNEAVSKIARGKGKWAAPISRPPKP